MWIIGGVLISLAIAKNMEPALLLPMGFGAILMNLPDSGAAAVLRRLFDLGIADYELFPLLLFLGIGAMIDFQPLLTNPKLMLFGAAAQFGIFFTLCLAAALGFPLRDAVSVADIGTADGPTSIYVATVLKSRYLPAILVAAYSYIALVPIIQPPVIRLCTTKAEQKIRMDYKGKPVSRTTRILFPILVTLVAGLAAPDAAALIGFLMFGNLLRECGVLDSLSDTARNVLANLVTPLLGLSVSAQMTAEAFLMPETLMILALGLAAFIADTAGGIFLAKFINLFCREKLNPMIGAAGISAFPMSARVVHKLGQKEDKQNYLLMQAVGVNVSGQIASVIAGGLLLALVRQMGG